MEASVISTPPPSSGHLWYRQPASDWNEALPLGSGSLGMMVFGGIEREVLQLNEESLWSGYPAQWDNPQCLEHLEEMRGLLFQGRCREAQDLCCRYLVCQGRGSDDPYYGSYQTAGELVIEAPVSDSSGYCRSLDLYQGLAETRFGSVRRRHLASHRYQVTASRIEGDREGCTLTFSRENCRVCCGGSRMTVTGQNDGPGAIAFCTFIEVETDGQITARETSLTVTGGSVITIWTCTATTYQHKDPESICLERLEKARGLGFEAVLEDQCRWMSEAMGRCRLTLPADPSLEILPTDRRLAQVQEGGQDAGLCQLYFDYGRYLLICSGWGLLPANLQGIWSKDMWTPWTGDYHININLQMNYWIVDAVGLEEYGEPLYRYIAFLAEHGADTARIMYNCRGWVAHTLTNPWGFTAPGQDPAWGSFMCAGAWCCRHLYEHYLYTGDRDFLRTYWPVIAGSARFFQDFLVKDPNTGYLVTAPSNSPENSYIDPVTGEKTAICAGPTMDMMIVRELFEITLRCSEVLGETDDLTETLPGLLAQLPPIRIGAKGGILEWQEDFEEWEPGHRHISQLYGLYPGW
ncbi:MAG: glycosyl hydrolase family 95 catalytic domain-containing protein, partial [Candidatus Onthomonas sp.]